MKSSDKMGRNISTHVAHKRMIKRGAGNQCERKAKNTTETLARQINMKNSNTQKDA